MCIIRESKLHTRSSGINNNRENTGNHFRRVYGSEDTDIDPLNQFLADSKREAGRHALGQVNPEVDIDMRSYLFVTNAPSCLTMVKSIFMRMLLVFIVVNVV